MRRIDMTKVNELTDLLVSLKHRYVQICECCDAYDKACEKARDVHDYNMSAYYGYLANNEKRKAERLRGVIGDIVEELDKYGL